MTKQFSLMTFGLCLALTAASPLRAESSNTLPENFKASINRMVQSVKETSSPELKRKILGNYLSKMTRGLAMVKTLLPLNGSDKQSVNALSEKFRADFSELNGEGKYTKVTDADLNQFAGFVQQDMEQAGISAGGLYISTGVILLLVILLILFH